MKDYDVIITGAGPAGCSTAAFLSKKGARVLLVDKAGFPRDKVCGDYLTTGTLNVLDQMGVAREVESAGGLKAGWALASSPDGNIMYARIPGGTGYRDYGIVLPRKTLDHLIWKHVRALPGVDTLEHFECTGLLGQSEGITGKMDGKDVSLSARYIVAADGAHSVIAKKLGLLNATDLHSGFAMRAYFENVEGLKPAIEVHVGKAMLPGYGWIFPTGDRSANVGVGVASYLNKKINLKALFDAFISKNPLTAGKFKNAEMVPDSCRGWPLPMGSFPGRRSKGNILLTGDAASFVDPLFGEGLYYAFKSGQYAAMVLARCMACGYAPDQASPIYERLWRRQFWFKEFLPGALMRPFMGRQWAVNFTVQASNRWPVKSRLFCKAVSHQATRLRLLNPF